MRGLRQLTLVTFKLYLRDPVSTFFTLAFPALLVVLFGAVFGNDPTPLFGGRGSMDVSMPAYTALVIGTVGFMGVPITTASYREQGILRRFRATPMRPISYIVADVTTNMAVTMAGVLVLMAVGWMLYRVDFEGSVLSVVLGILLSVLAMSTFGYLIGSLASGGRMAQVIGMVVFYPMMFLSGAGMPIEVLPESLRRASDFLPLTYAARLIRGLWFGEAWGEHLAEVVVLSGMVVVLGGVAARLFRWE